MLRLLHTADVHLGARHDDLGEQASAQRERQFAAFTAAVDLALTEKADLFLIAGPGNAVVLVEQHAAPERGCCRAHSHHEIVRQFAAHKRVAHVQILSPALLFNEPFGAGNLP